MRSPAYHSDTRGFLRVFQIDLNSCLNPLTFIYICIIIKIDKKTYMKESGIWQYDISQSKRLKH